MLFKFEKEPVSRICDNIHIVLGRDNIPEVPDERYGYNDRLNECRNRIDNIDSESWKKVRWYINVYDFQVKDPIINRAFYKYWEIVNEFEIFEDYDENQLVLHCAEAPGGFIQGTNIYLQVDRIVQPVKTDDAPVSDDGFTVVRRRNKSKRFDNYRIYTISLNKDLPQYKNYNLPSYNKNILNKYLCITYGRDNTGDINNLANIEYLKYIAKRPFYLVTADGGFDEGTDFNHKEQLHYHLILSEIYAALAMQKRGGHFILKMFDVLTETSIHLLYLLASCYDQLYIYKPKTSRPTNSEKYIVCKYFNMDEMDRSVILTKLQRLSKDISDSRSKFVQFRIFREIPERFVNRICEINQALLDKQCLHLESAIELCNDPDFLADYENRLEESLEKRREIFHAWEELYNLNSYV